MNAYKKLKKSFTLIELLVVIAIIGSLSALIVPNYMGTRERSRDAQRKSDLKQIQKALEMYKQDKNPPAYPTTTSGRFGTYSTCNTQFATTINGRTVVYMNKIPCDPLGPTPYYYSVINSDLTYTLCACIENQADPEADDGNCFGACSNTIKHYIVTEP